MISSCDCTNVCPPPAVAMESLLDAADGLCMTPDPEFPDLDIPEELKYLEEPSNEVLQLRESPGQGQGWFAARDLPEGTRIMVAKPIAMILDWEEDDAVMEVEHVNDDKGLLQDQAQMEESAGALLDDHAMDHEGTVKDVLNNKTEEEEDDNGEEDETEEEPETANDDEREPRQNEILLVDILEGLPSDPDVWFKKLCNLFPRNDVEVNKLPAWVCSDDTVFMQVETALADLRSLPEFSNDAVQEIAKRLPHIIRYNILSVETCSELFSYPGPGGHSSLAGVALYYYPSFFNHSAQPNCNRWAIGDVMVFVTNQAVTKGSEICISYIEHDVLCESPYRRNLMLRMDFQDGDTEAGIPPNQGEKDGPEMPVVDPDVQNELMMTDPFERLSQIEQLLQQASGKALPAEKTDMNDQADKWFQCDIHNLRILQAITLEALGQHSRAFELWEQAVEFCQLKLPPNDESCVAIHTQAALSARHSGKTEKAQVHANAALRIHNVVFGGGVNFFRRRYRRDLALSLRPSDLSEKDATSVVDFLWPVQSASAASYLQ